MEGSRLGKLGDASAMNFSTSRSVAVSKAWDQRYQDGRDGWELGEPAPPLVQFMKTNPQAPKPPGRVLIPGCGRGHEAALVSELGFSAIGLDFSSEALQAARRIHGEDTGRLEWLQADLFDLESLSNAGIKASSLAGIVEHTCFCAIEPRCRNDYVTTMKQLLEPGGWLLGLFWCHAMAGGPPWGSEAGSLEAQFLKAGLVRDLWEPASGSVAQRNDEWLGLWRKPL